MEKWNYALGALGSMIAFWLLPMDQALGFFLGAVISCANFAVIRRLVERMLVGAKTGNARGAAMLFLPKMMALMAALAVTLLFLPVAPGYVAVGFSIFFVSIGIETVRFLFTPSDNSIPNGDSAH